MLPLNLVWKKNSIWGCYRSKRGHKIWPLFFCFNLDKEIERENEIYKEIERVAEKRKKGKEREGENYVEKEKARERNREWKLGVRCERSP